VLSFGNVRFTGGLQLVQWMSAPDVRGAPSRQRGVFFFLVFLCDMVKTKRSYEQKKYRLQCRCALLQFVTIQKKAERIYASQEKCSFSICDV